MARKFMAAFTEARKRNLTPDIVADNLHVSASYWVHEQEYCNDICRLMRKRCKDATYKDGFLFKYCENKKETFFGDLLPTDD